MPTSSTVKASRTAKRAGKRPTTQAGPFVKEEMKKMKRGTGNARSRRQAVAIGLSEARRAGVSLGTPRQASAATRRKAARDSAAGRRKTKTSSRRRSTRT